MTVKDIGNGNEINVKDILSNNPAIFNITFPIPSQYLKTFKNLTCVYWDDEENDWSTEGVTSVKKFYNHGDLVAIQCKAYHLTEFSLINIDWKNEVDAPDIIANPISDSTCKYYVIIYLSFLCLVSLIFYIISLFTKD